MPAEFTTIILPTSAIVVVCISIIGYIVWKVKLKPYLKKLAKRIGSEVEEGVTRAIENKLPEFQARVKNGMIEGITDMPNQTTRITSEVIRDSIKNLDLLNLMKPPEKQ